MTDLTLSDDELGLFTDLYELTMLQAYWAEGMHGSAVFSLFFRHPPVHRNFMLACGQEHAARLATGLRFPRAQLDRLETIGLFREPFLRWLEAFRFSGEILAMPEGTPVFPHEPILEVHAPVAEAQVLETLLMNLITTETVLASKAARITLAADGRPVMDFGMRRMHGTDAALRGVRAYSVGGIHATSNVLASLRYGLPASGTMAHSFIQAHHDELEAFRTYGQLYPGTTLLVDTYDSMAAVGKVIRLVREEGLQIGAIRLDSGNLAELAHQARAHLDAAGLEHVQIVASGGLDEWAIRDLLTGGAPIDRFGVGTEMGASVDAPSLDLAYKLTEYDGEPRLKNAPGKQLHPGPKQVWRFSDAGGRYSHDEITRRDEHRDGVPLLTPIVQAGTPLGEAPQVTAGRDRAWAAIARFPDAMRELEAPAAPYPVHFSDALERLRRETVAGLGY
ncbi:nicotinate phosphoribosyltransferase [Aquisalimonas asiatica]|uniref:Nicotinate phosphoribosyltransferase n=1 Tax=Aquisalimonas asiatica TaxID=406100 RepID=A0A1H8U3F4_9GAMM|nr:nicotinate phosphoribosyltransferase [Aquisalimonas asiatica]SEO97373.1 nicotinate phosphoribosyltransferase [Aquisalimonas asiatica]